ncbi:hypothetical protein [Microbacterium sp. SS28]|uniref:hypothetical protein n=1 Tax=Microbacterium sp. SS28 TaxID=2919948 RepID=UPI001FA997E8|nr:hypothetical protein [Microbacterium sp. SS28]
MSSVRASLRSSRAALVGAALTALLLGSSAASANALALGDEPTEPPGLQGRGTHMTLLTTQEADCTEVFIPRAVTVEGARALVPGHYELVTTVSAGVTFARFVVWDYVCEKVSVDGQKLDQRTHISIGAIAITTRDQVPLPPNSAFYTVAIRTDNPVLAARYRQVGLPAEFAPDMVATVSDNAATPFQVAFAVPDAGYIETAVADAAPVPVLDDGGPVLYHVGQSGEVLLSYDNSSGAAVSAVITADYRQYTLLVPIIGLARLLEIRGVRFANSLIRGDWEATLVRLD